MSNKSIAHTFAAGFIQIKTVTFNYFWYYLDFFYSSKPPVVSSLTCDKINVQGIKKQVYFSKMITVDQKTTSNIPVERYCLGYALNQQTYNMSQNGSRSLQSKKMQMFKNTLFLVYIGYTPKQFSLICSSGYGDF